MPIGGGLGGGLPRSGGRGTVVSGAAPKAGDMPPAGRTGEDASATVQPCAPAHEAALPLSGRRGLREASSARRAPRHTAHRAHDAPRRLPTAHGMEHTTPAPAGAGLLAASACATPRPRQRLGRARARPLAPPRGPLGPGLSVHLAQPAGRPAAPGPLGAVCPGPRPRHERASAYDGRSTSERVCLQALLCTAEARTPEEPDAGKLHVRDGTGGAG